MSYIYRFLSNHESGEFKDYAELIKETNNINAKNSSEEGWSALHRGLDWLGFILIC